MRKLIWIAAAAMAAAGAVTAATAALAADLPPEQAAAHVLNRLAYGPKPGDIERVTQMGVQRYIDAQLAASAPLPPALTARLDALQKLLLSQQYAFDDSQIGKVMPVLFEKPARDAGQLMGRTPYLQPVHVTADAALIGTVADVRIERRTANSLHGVLA